MAKWHGFEGYYDRLVNLSDSIPPVHAEDLKAVVGIALQEANMYYKHVVYAVERWIRKELNNKPHHLLTGAWVIDAICRKAQQHLGQRSKYAQRFASNLEMTLKQLFQCSPQHLPQLQRLCRKWVESGLFRASHLGSMASRLGADDGSTTPPGAPPRVCVARGPPTASSLGAALGNVPAASIAALAQVLQLRAAAAAAAAGATSPPPSSQGGWASPPSSSHPNAPPQQPQPPPPPPPQQQQHHQQQHGTHMHQQRPPPPPPPPHRHPMSPPPPHSHHHQQQQQHHPPPPSQHQQPPPPGGGSGGGGGGGVGGAAIDLSQLNQLGSLLASLQQQTQQPDGTFDYGDELDDETRRLQQRARMEAQAQRLQQPPGAMGGVGVGGGGGGAVGGQQTHQHMQPHLQAQQQQSHQLQAGGGGGGGSWGAPSGTLTSTQTPYNPGMVTIDMEAVKAHPDARISYWTDDRGNRWGGDKVYVPTRTLYVGQFPESVTQEYLHEIFSRFGEVTRIKRLDAQRT